MLSTPNQIKSFLKQHNLAIQKKLGQHFLIDKDVLKKIVDSADLKKEDVVFEVGPGLGILTEELAKKVGKVFAIEKDRKMSEVLKKVFREKKNVKVINEDILKISNFQFLISNEFLISNFQNNYKVVSNLPYYITSPAIRFFLENKFKPSLMVLLVQKEVAERITAKPGDMSILSISVQFYGDPKIVDFVSKDCFYPRPEVDSAILKIKVYDKPKIKISDAKTFFKVVKFGFSQKRKQLHNALAAGLYISNKEAKELLTKSGINPSNRAQDLDLKSWGKLADRLLTDFFSGDIMKKK